MPYNLRFLVSWTCRVHRKMARCGKVLLGSKWPHKMSSAHVLVGLQPLLALSGDTLVQKAGCGAGCNRSTAMATPTSVPIWDPSAFQPTVQYTHICAQILGNEEGCYTVQRLCQRPNVLVMTILTQLLRPSGFD